MRSFRWAMTSALLVLMLSPTADAFGAHADPGGTLWTATYHGGDPTYGNGATGVVSSADGSTVFVTGQSGSHHATSAFATAAYDAATGQQRWAKRYRGPTDQSEAHAIALSPLGSAVYVTGQTGGYGSNVDDYATVAYDASTGRRLWVALYDGPVHGQDIAWRIVVRPDGSEVFITGYSEGANGFPDTDYTTVAYDAATGQENWVARYDGPSHGFDVAYGLGVSPDGSTVFVTGGSAAGSVDFATIAYSAATGSQIWFRRYNGPPRNYDLADALAVSPDGTEIFVTGDSSGRRYASDYATVAYDAATGARLWVAHYDGPAHSEDVPAAIAVDPASSRVFVTGFSDERNERPDYATVAYDARNGGQLWVRRYNGPARRDDAARAVAVSPDGASVYVTGESTWSRFDADYLTIAYRSSSGRRLWTAHYAGSAHEEDGANAVAASSDGSAVFVTGSSIGVDGAEYVTIAYGTN